MSLLEEAKSAGSSSVAQVSSSVSVSLLPGVFKEGSTPPLSPKSSPLSPRSPMRRSGSGPTNLSSPLRKSSDPLREVIPQVSHRLALVMHTMQYTTLCRLQKKWTLFLFLSFLVFLITMLILWVCLCFLVLGGHLFLGDNLCWHSVLFSWWTSCIKRNGKSVFGPHWSNICWSSWWPSCIWFVHSLDLAPCRGRLLSSVAYGLDGFSLFHAMSSVFLHLNSCFEGWGAVDCSIYDNYKGDLQTTIIFLWHFIQKRWCQWHWPCQKVTFTHSPCSP